MENREDLTTNLCSKRRFCIPSEFTFMLSSLQPICVHISYFQTQTHCFKGDVQKSTMTTIWFLCVKPDDVDRRCGTFRPTNCSRKTTRTVSVTALKLIGPRQSSTSEWFSIRNTGICNPERCMSLTVCVTHLVVFRVCTQQTVTITIGQVVN